MFYTRTYVCFTDAILSSLAAGKPINACREIFLQQLPFYLTQKLVTSHINGMSFLITSYWKYNLWGKVHYLKIVCTWCNKYHRKSHQKILISRICGLRPILKTKTLNINVVPDKFIWMVNCLNYLNYEAIPLSSITCHKCVLGTS